MVCTGGAYFCHQARGVLFDGHYHFVAALLHESQCLVANVVEIEWPTTPIFSDGWWPLTNSQLSRRPKDCLL
jgi:hypothetical protein